MAPHVERILDNFALGEGPHWDEATQSLYFVDIVHHNIYRYDPGTKKVTKAAIGEYAAFIIPVKDQNNTFIITKTQQLAIITWDGESDSVTVLKTIGNDSNLKFNDGKCDPTGRLWTGTLGMKDSEHEENDRGSIYSLQKGKIKKHEDGISMSNGLAFNVQLKKMYYIDSITQTVDEFDFDVENGTIKNRQPIFTLSKHDIPGGADGMTIDADGNLWVAIFNGGRVVKIDPRKPETLLYTLSLPAKQVTSVAFGGRNLDELYVTTALIEYGTTEKLSPPENGAIYRVTGLGTRGLPAERFVL